MLDCLCHYVHTCSWEAPVLIVLDLVLYLSLLVYIVFWCRWTAHWRGAHEAACRGRDVPG